MSTPDVHTMAGAYALYAVSAEEKEVFEGHLRGCTACRWELAEFQATATRLADAVATVPPQRTKQRVLEEIARTRQLPPAVPSTRPSSHRRRRRRLLAAAAATVLVAAAGAAGLGIQRLQGATEQREQIAAIIGSPDTHTVHGPVSGGGNATVAMSRREGAAIIILDRLPPPPAGRTYQMWLLHGDDARSAGTIDTTGQVRATRIVDSPSVSDIDGFGLTLEPAGGSRHPTPPIIAQLPLP